MDTTPQTPDTLGTIGSVKNLIVTNQIFQSTAEGLTAHAGGGQALATPINATPGLPRLRPSMTRRSFRSQLRAWKSPSSMPARLVWMCIRMSDLRSITPAPM